MSKISTVTVQPKSALTAQYKVDLSEKLENRRFDVYYNGMKSINDESVDFGCREYETQVNVIKKRPKFHFIPRILPQPDISKYLPEQAYEGTVLSINNDGTFTARLIDLTNNGPDEEGEFNLSELNGDEKFVTPGNQFTWIIGMQKRGTQDQRVSEIRFRRIPAFTKEAIDRAEAKAIELEQHINKKWDRNKTFEIDF